MEKIKEVIVVEGRDDVTAVKAAVDAEMIIVNGFAVHKKETLEKIRVAQEKRGIIILTDPDYAGDKIRRTIEDYVPGAKHAYISRSEGTRLRDGNIGVENASPEDIRKALEKAKYKTIDIEDTFTMADMLEYGLNGRSESKGMRSQVGSELGIGYSNAKQFLSKLNHFGITKEELEEVVDKVNS